MLKRKNMTKPLILLLLTATLLAGCSREEIPVPGSKGVEICFRLLQVEQPKDPMGGSPQSSADTKAYTSAPHAEQAARNLHAPATRALLGDRTTVRVVAYKAVSGVTTPQGANYVAEQTYVADASGQLTPCTVNADGSFAAAAPGAALRLIAGDYDFFAITPALPLDATRTAADVPNGVDYATSRTAAVAVLPVENTKTVALTQLQRQTARIILVVKKDPSYTSLNQLQVDATAGKQGVVLDRLAPALTGVVLGAPLTQGTGATGSKLVFPAAKFTQTDATELTLTTCVLPKTTSDVALSYDLILGRLFAGNQSNTQLSLSGTVPAVGLIAGNSYRFILTISPTGAILSVDGWDAGGNPDNELGRSPDIAFSPDGGWDAGGDTDNEMGK